MIEREERGREREREREKERERKRERDKNITHDYCQVMRIEETMINLIIIIINCWVYCMSKRS